MYIRRVIYLNSNEFRELLEEIRSIVFTEEKDIDEKKEISDYFYNLIDEFNCDGIIYRDDDNNEMINEFWESDELFEFLKRKALI